MTLPRHVIASVALGIVDRQSAFELHGALGRFLAKRIGDSRQRR